jgi:mRNA interferase MazF
MTLHKRFQVWLVQLDPTPGREINKTRPCVIVSPDEMSALSTVIVAPMTTRGFDFPCRVLCTFQGKQGLVLLDQLRAVDKSRLTKKLGVLPKETQEELCNCLQEMFTL